MTGLCHNRTYHLFTKLLYREEGPCFYSNVHAFGSCFYADMFHCFLRRNDLSRKVTYSEPTPFDLFFYYFQIELSLLFFVITLEISVF